MYILYIVYENQPLSSAACVLNGRKKETYVINIRSVVLLHLNVLKATHSIRSLQYWPPSLCNDDRNNTHIERRVYCCCYYYYCFWCCGCQLIKKKARNFSWMKKNTRAVADCRWSIPETNQTTCVRPQFQLSLLYVCLISDRKGASLAHALTTTHSWIVVESPGLLRSPHKNSLSLAHFHSIDIRLLFDPKFAECWWITSIEDHQMQIKQIFYRNCIHQNSFNRIHQ